MPEPAMIFRGYDGTDNTEGAAFPDRTFWRHYFAGQALAGRAARGAQPGCAARSIDYARRAVEDADALLAELEQEGQEGRLDRLDALLANKEPPEGLCAAIDNVSLGENWEPLARAAWRWFREQLGAGPERS